MAGLRWIARYLIVVPVVPRSLLAALVVTTVVGVTAMGAGLTTAGGGVASTRLLTPVLLLQLFAAASGFRVPARRGHYDLLLTTGESRAAVGVVHWLMSVLPGVVSWSALAATEWISGGRHLIAPDVLLALCVTSTVPWALTVPLPRLSGAIICLVGLAAAAAMFELDAVWPLRPAAAAGVAVAALASVAVALVWIQRMDVPLESGQ